MQKKSKCQQACSCGCGKRCSTRRHAVMEALSSAGGHLNAEELLALARKRSPGIGIATVYRSVKCLCGCGKAVALKLGDGTAVYEAASPLRPRVHLVCSSCGAVAEAGSPELERLAGSCADKRGFSVSVLEVRGVCRACRSKGKI